MEETFLDGMWCERAVDNKLKEIDMMKQLTGIGAAIAFAAVSMGAHAAALTIDGESSVTYAKETLLKTKTEKDADGGTHYTLGYAIGGPRNHVVVGKTSIYTTGGANDAYVIRYAFSGMVLAGVPFIKITGGGTPPKEDGETPIILGGFAGTNQVVFQVTGGDVKRKDDPAEDPTITLTAKFAISGEGSGTITRVVQNRALRDLGIEEWTETKALSGAVKALPALKETVTAKAPDPIAHSAFDFMQFKAGSAVTPNVSTSVGSIRLTVVSSGSGESKIFYRNAEVEKEMEDGSSVEKLLQITGPDGSSPYDNSVTFSGNFTFVEKVGLSDSEEACDGTISELRKPSKADSTVLTDEANPQPAMHFEPAAKYLCIQVDGKTAMPNTTPYQVTTKYKGIPDAAFPPEGNTYDLARIVRDGTTFYLPYLTTYSGYNQRISIVNRGKATTYSLIELASEDGVTVSAKPQASGDLPQGQTVLRASDLVEIEDGTRASGTLTIVADYGVISASLQQVNKATGAIDTVILAHGAATYVR